MSFSKYNIFFNNNVFNTKTRAVIKLETEKLLDFRNGKLEKFSSEELSDLFRLGFLVKNDEINDIKNQLAIDENENLNIIIFATKQCNFRCLYCYENHLNEKLDNSDYNKILDFIYSKNNIKRINISWFGGEPTIEYNSIVEFMLKLNKFAAKRNILVTSSMTTNFYNLNIEKFTELVNLNVKYYQVTVDGLEATHNYYRPLINSLPSYDKIMKNLLDANSSNLTFSIMIRLNYDNHTNYDSYLKMLSESFGLDARFSFFINEICDFSDEKLDFVCSNEEKYKRRKEIIKLMKRYNLIKPQTLNSLINIGGCYANIKNNVAFDSNGNIMKCTVHLDDLKNILGNIKSLDKISFNDDFWLKNRFENCEECPTFPLCLGKICKYSKLDTFEVCSKKNISTLVDVLEEVWK